MQKKVTLNMRTMVSLVAFRSTLARHIHTQTDENIHALTLTHRLQHTHTNNCCGSECVQQNLIMDKDENFFVSRVDFKEKATN